MLYSIYAGVKNIIIIVILKTRKRITF